MRNKAQGLLEHSSLQVVMGVTKGQWDSDHSLSCTLLSALLHTAQP